jgi:hypothetical protein
LHQTNHSLRIHFERTGWYSKVTRLKGLLVLVRLEIVLFLPQDRCTVGADHTIGSNIALAHPIEHLGDLGHVESHFGPFGERFSIGAR